jgi:DNA-binding SARP family transcriptional activator
VGVLGATQHTPHVGLLGPVTCERDGRLLALGGPKQRAVLAALALEPGRIVSVDALLAAVWGDDAAAGAAKTLQVYVANLRRTLEVDRAPGTPPTVLVTREPGYVLEVDPDAVDAVRFERAIERARGLATRGDLSEAARSLRAALDDWRGAPLAGLEALPLHDHAVPRLLDLRLDALELCCQAELDLGFSGSLPELEALVVEAPYRERLWALLVRALYASGRQHDALQAYQGARRRLLDDLGVEPGPELRDIERRVLVQDETLDVTATAAPPTTAEPDGEAARKRVSIVSVTGSDLDARALGAIVADHVGAVIDRGGSTFVVGFGVPRVALDDVDRAAGLALVLRHRGLSVGLATGWASAAGTTVSGAPVSRATELARAAPRGQARLDPTSRDLLAGRATVTPAEDGTFTLLELAARPATATDVGPFVGRDAELELLASVWHAVDRRRLPSVVTLVGDAGSGTSRLAQELAARVQAPLLRVEIDPTVEPDVLLDRLSTAGDGSIVLLEHVHRATRTASWAVARWVEAEPDGAVLCIATATPDLRASSPGWPGAVPLAMTLDLPPLDHAEAGRLAAHLMGDELVGTRAATVAAIAGGNPQFVSELAQHLATVGEAAPLPDRVGTLIATRLEQLSSVARRVLETMAVVGTSAEVQQLDDVVEHDDLALDDLVATGLVRVEDEGAIRVPEVVADVVLTTMADDRAADLHERAAESATTLTARAAHLEQAALRSPAGTGSSASAAVATLAELAWRTWSRGDIESAVDAVCRSIAVARRGEVDLVGNVRAARRRLASPLVAGRLDTTPIDVPLRASIGAWDANRPVEQELIEAARSLGATTPHALLRDRCAAVVTALSTSDADDQGSSASSSA